MNTLWCVRVVMWMCWYVEASDVKSAPDSSDSDVATIKQVISEIPSDHPLRHTFSLNRRPNYHHLTSWLGKQYPDWHHLPHGNIINLMSKWHYGQYHTGHNRPNFHVHNKPWFQVHKLHSGEVHHSGVHHSGEVHHKPFVPHNNVHIGHVYVTPINRPIRPINRPITPIRPDLRPYGFQVWLARWKAREVGECGIPEVESVLKSNHFRIAGGNIARPGSWPWMVSMFNRQLNQDACAGVLISRQWVVTAAHCFDAHVLPMLPDIKNWELRLGKFNVNVSERTQQNFEIADLLVHENYRWRRVANYYDPKVFYHVPDHDIALLRLDRPVVINRWVKPLCLPLNDEVPSLDQRCVIAGWGTTDKVGYPGLLNEAIVPVYGYERCRLFPGYDKLVTRDMVCAGFPRGKVDTCNGDSGGPLQCKMNNKWVLTELTIAMMSKREIREQHIKYTSTQTTQTYSHVEVKYGVANEYIPPPPRPYQPMTPTITMTGVGTL